MAEKVGSAYVEMALDNSRLHRDLQAMKSEVAAATTAASAAATRSAAGATAATTSMFRSMATGAQRAGVAIGNAGKKMETFGRKAMFSGRAVTAFFSLPLLALGAAAVKSAMELDQVFTKIQALSNVKPVQLAEWRIELMKLSSETGVAAAELGEALYFLASAGLKPAQVMEALDASAKGAAVGLGQAGDIARVVANALNAYAGSGLTALEVTNTLAAGVKAGTAAPEEFAAALGRLLPIASKAEVEFDEIVASLSALSNIGLDVNEGVTAMSGLLAALYNPGTKAAKTLAAIGLSADDVRASIADGGLLDALIMLEDATGGNIDTLADIIPNIRALRGQFGLTGKNAEQVARIFDQVTSATTDMDDAFKETQKSSAFKLQQSMTDLKNSLIDLGNVIIPILLDDVLPVVKSIVDGFKGMSDGTKKFIVQVGLAVIALGPLMILLGGIARLVSVPLKVAGWIASATGKIAGGTAAAGTTAGAAFAAKFNLAVLAGLAGLAIGTWLNEKFNISDNVAEWIVPDTPTVKPGTDWQIDDAAGAAMLALQRAAASGALSIDDARVALAEFNETFDLDVGIGQVWRLAQNLFKARSEVEDIIGPLGEQKDALYDANMAAGDFDANLMLLARWLKEGKKALAEMPPDLDAMRGAALESMAAQAAHADASADLTAKIRAQSLAAAGAAAPFIAMAAGEKATARYAREAAGAIDTMTGAAKFVPPNVTTKVDVPGLANARKQMGEYERDIREVPGAKSTTVTTPGMLAARNNMRKLKGEAEALPPSESITTLTPGAEDALAKLQAINAATYNKSQSVTTYFSSVGTKLGSAEGGIMGAANGGVMAGGSMMTAAGGFIARKPTVLVAEGKYSTPLGRGAEAILPLNDQTMGRLANAIVSGMKGGGREMNMHFHQNMPPVQEIVRLVSREMSRAM